MMSPAANRRHSDHSNEVPSGAIGGLPPTKSKHPPEGSIVDPNGRKKEIEATSPALSQPPGLASDSQKGGSESVPASYLSSSPGITGATYRPIKEGEVPELDEVDLMMCHELFPALISLAADVKVARSKLAREMGYDVPFTTADDDSGRMVGPKEAFEVVERIKNESSYKGINIQRGIHALTDCMMDDSMTVLQRELRSCNTRLENLRARSPKISTPVSKGSNKAPPAPPAPPPPPPPTPSSASRNPPERTIKYAKWQTDILMQWMIDNVANPYLKSTDTINLTKKTGLTKTQVTTWIGNIRKRSRKNCSLGRKPHHFIDFLIMSQVREQNPQQKSPANSTKEGLTGSSCRLKPSPPATQQSRTHSNIGTSRHSDPTFFSPTRLRGPKSKPSGALVQHRIVSPASYQKKSLSISPKESPLRLQRGSFSNPTKHGAVTKNGLKPDIDDNGHITSGHTNADLPLCNKARDQPRNPPGSVLRRQDSSYSSLGSFLLKDPIGTFDDDSDDDSICATVNDGTGGGIALIPKKLVIEWDKLDILNDAIE